MEQFINKQYKLKTVHNYDKYLELLGIGLFTRKIILGVSPVVVLTKNDDGSFTFTTSTPIRTFVINFKHGEEFEETRADGIQLQSMIFFEGNALIHTQTEKSGRKFRHTSEFTEEAVTTTTTVEGWDLTCKREYERVK